MMNERTFLGDPANVKTLADRLSKCPEVTRYDKDNEKEAWVLAHSFADLEESFKKFLLEQLPRLTDDRASPPELLDALLDIGEEFRHILYHIHDPEFYRYLNTERVS